MKWAGEATLLPRGSDSTIAPRWRHELTKARKQPLWSRVARIGMPYSLLVKKEPTWGRSPPCRSTAAARRTIRSTRARPALGRCRSRCCSRRFPRIHICSRIEMREQILDEFNLGFVSHVTILSLRGVGCHLVGVATWVGWTPSFRPTPLAHPLLRSPHLGRVRCPGPSRRHDE